MRYCDYCGAKIPAHAHFCGNCGRIPGDEPMRATGITPRSGTNNLASATPPLLDNFPYSPFEGAPSLQLDADMTITKQLSEEEELILRTWDYNDRQSDESQTVSMWPDVIAPLAAGGLEHVPASNVPFVPNTPQIGGVPVVQGSPQIGNVPGAQGMPNAGGNSPSLHELAHQAPSAAPHQPAPSAPQHGWTWEQHPSPPHHPGHHQPPPQQHPPLHNEHSPAKNPHRWRRHEPVEHKHLKTHQPHKLRLGRAHKAGVTTTSKAATGIVAKWAIVLLAAIVVLASGGIIFVLASSPTLSLSGGSAVSAGGLLQVHGRGFMPGGTITLTINNGQSVEVARSYSTRTMSMGGQSGAADIAEVAGILNSDQAHNSNRAIVASITGTFDAAVKAQPNWLAGKNTLHARENNGSRSADLPFTVLAQSAQPAHLAINPTTLDFGTVPQGGKVAESVLISNTGGAALTWNATTDSSSWLSLQKSSDTLQPGGAQDALYALVDTGNLKQGTDTGQIQIHSNGGDAQIMVKVHVGPPAVTKQAQLSVNPSSINFGQLTPGQQVSTSITIGNQGTLALQWQGNTSSASWLSLSASSGSVQPGAVPQQLQVTVDTNSHSLQTGSNSAAITIHSNGGDATIPVTLTLLSGSTPTPPTPTPPSPTPPSPTPPSSTPPSPTPTQRTLTSQQTQSQTVNATGQGTTPGTHATGVLKFANTYLGHSNVNITVYAGTVFDNTDSNCPNVQMMIDATITVIGSEGANSNVTAPAHVVQVGANGNVTCWYHLGGYNDPPPQYLQVNSIAPFTGGTDPQTYIVVQQSDIDGAAKVLKASTTQSAVADLNSQLQPNEHLVGNPQCTYNVTSDHAAGDQATNVTVTVQAMCTATAST